MTDEILFVGGPVHGQLLDVPGWPLPTAYCVRPASPAPLTASAYMDGPAFIADEIVYYQLRRGQRPNEFEPAPVWYIHRDARLFGTVHTADGRLADHILAQTHPDAVPTCFAPACTSVAPTLFTALESGRLGGKQVEFEQEIRLCPSHANDIYLSQGVYGADLLPEWLRDDHNFDALDAYDIGHVPFNDDMERMMAHRTRALRMNIFK